MTTPDETGGSDSDRDADRYDVLVIGGGVAGLTAAIFTARAGLETVVADGGDSTLARSAHLENFPGFPAGVNPRTFLDMLDAQARRNSVEFRVGRIETLDRDRAVETGTPVGEAGDSAADADSETVTVERDTPVGGFVVSLAEGGKLRAQRAIVASWSDTEYLAGLGVDVRSAGSKQFIQPDGSGRTNVDGLYAAGRLTERYHQAIVSAGHGAQVAITLIHDSSTPYYHDWVAPEGYFTDRGYDVPPGCEEVGDTERRTRERESIATMREYFEEPHSDEQPTHPGLCEQ